MQQIAINATAKILLSLWPRLEPLVLAAVVQIARQVVQSARDGQFPQQWKFLEPGFDAAADQILHVLDQVTPAS